MLQSSPFEACSTTHCIVHLDRGRDGLTRDIRELLANLITAEISDSNVNPLASRLIHDINQDTGNVSTNPLDSAPRPPLTVASVLSKIEAFVPLRRPQSPTSPDKERLAPVVEKVEITKSSPSCQKMVPLVKSTAPTMPDNFVLEMVHMIDTGGQPELMEVMPSVVHNADLAIALLNLEYSLSEHQQIDYHEEGVSYEWQTQSRLTGRDIILKLASTLHGKKYLNESFRLLIVATHRNCVEGDLEARVETLNRELCSLLLPAFENELLLFEKPNKIAFVLDLKNPDDSDKRALELIRREMGKPGLGRTFDSPTPSLSLSKTFSSLQRVLPSMKNVCIA